MGRAHVWTTATVSLSMQPVLTAPLMGSVLAAPRVQLAALKLPPPGGTLLLLQLSVPLAAVADSCALSLHDALPILGLPTGTVSGVQLTTVLVACLRAVTTKVPALLRWVASPL